MSTSANWQRWALGLFVGLAFAFGAYAWADVRSDVTALSGLTSRMAVVESTVAERDRQITAALAEIRERLQRIEDQQLAIFRELSRRPSR